jgi:hypothetical protein
MNKQRLGASQRLRAHHEQRREQLAVRVRHAECWVGGVCLKFKQLICLVWMSV